MSKGSPLLSLIKEKPKDEIPSSRHARKKLYIAKTEELWQEQPDKYLPDRHLIDTLRIERSWSLLQSHLTKEALAILDLGCGFSPLAKFLDNHQLTFLDSSSQALKNFPGKKILHDALPITKLDEEQYDLVICTDLIAELFPQDYRLAMGEIARLMTKDGKALISTPLDIHSLDALEKFLALLDTEFEIISLSKSYHRLAVSWLERLKRWKFLRKFSTLGSQHLKRSRKTILWLEKISHFLWDEDAVSHVIVLVKRKPLF